jgi:hypothetical protein
MTVVSACPAELTFEDDVEVFGVLVPHESGDVMDRMIRFVEPLLGSRQFERRVSGSSGGGARRT